MRKIKNFSLILLISLVFAVVSTISFFNNKSETINANEGDRHFYYTNELKDKSIVFYGDSITARHGLKSYEKDYIQMLQEEFHFYYSNQAVGGATWTDVPPSTNNIFRQLKNSEALYRDADCVSIFLGTNDFGLNRQIGEINSYDVETIYGSINTVFDTIISANPDVKFMLITSINRYDFTDSNYNDNGLTNGAGYTIEDLRNVIRTSAKKYNCTLVDLANLVDENNMSALLNADKLHVVEEGYKEIANVIKSVQK